MSEPLMDVVTHEMVIGDALDRGLTFEEFIRNFEAEAREVWDELVKLREALAKAREQKVAAQATGRWLGGVHRGMPPVWEGRKC